MSALHPRSHLLALLTTLALCGDVAGQHVPTDTLLLHSAEGDGGFGTYFGLFIDAEDDVLAVGASDEHIPGPSNGAAYVYERTGGGWRFALRITPTPGSVEQGLGQAIAVDGGDVLVPTLTYGPGGAGGGRVYVLREVGGAWAPVDTLAAAETAEGDSFGYALDAAGGIAVVGAPNADRPHEGAGEAYVFERDAATGDWLHAATLAPEDLRYPDAYGEFFGLEVYVVSPTRVAVAAPTQNLGAEPEVGALYIYDRGPDGTWALFRKTRPPADEQDAGRYFGQAGDVAFHRGDLLQLGRDAAPASWPLRLRRYRLVGADTVWTRVEPPFPVAYPGVHIGEVYGGALEVRGDTLAAVTFARPPEPEFEDGLSFVYTYDEGAPPGEEWALRATFAREASGPAVPNLGYAGVLTATDLFVGNLASEAGDVGAVAVFDLPEIVPAEPPPLPHVGVSLRVAPNPVARSGALHLSLAAPGVAHVAVYDALGRAVATLHDGPLPAGAVRLALPALPPGVYLACAATPTGSTVARFAVVR
jgi:hypothetical protein